MSILRKNGVVYKKILSDFIKYYQNSCSEYMNTHADNFSGEYFSKWYQSEGLQKLEDVQRHLNISMLDSKVESFTELYRHYIEESLNECDEDLLLENLYAVPERMLYEFSMFGFLYTEAACREEAWVDFELSGFDGGVWIADNTYIRQGNIQFQSYGESGNNIPAPIFLEELAWT